MGDRLLITGADGFTGRYLIQLALRSGYEVHALVQRDGVLPPTPGQFVHSGDIVDPARIAAIVQSVKPTHVVHLAAIAFVGAADIDAMYRVNVIGTRNILAALAKCDVPPQAVLIASSANIYGNRTAGALAEEAAFDPVNDYAVSKVAAEYVANLYGEHLPLIVVRPFNYTGIGQSIDFIIPKIVDHIRRRVPVIELGRLDVERDFSDVRDVVSRYLHLLQAPDAIGGIFNICSGRSHSLEAIVDMACTIGEHRIEVRINPAFVRDRDVKILRGCGNRLRSTIGEDRPFPLIETLRWMLEA